MTKIYDKYHKTVLKRLYSIRCIGGKHTSKENTLKGFPKSDRGRGKTALNELIRRNLIIPKSTSYGEQISLNSKLIKDVKLIINPDESFADSSPYEDSLNMGYEKQPFKETHGNKMIRGVKSKYAYHKSIYDPNMYICYVSVNGTKRRTIKLGSFDNPESLLAKAVGGIDSNFKEEAFSKADLIVLGKKMVENRQPIHAIIDMLSHFGYIDQVSKRQYKRTEKKLPKPPLDMFRNHDGVETPPRNKNR